MLGKFEIDALQDDENNAVVVEGATVTVRRESDGGIADLYDDQDTGSPGPASKSNPFTVVGSSTIKFFAETDTNYRVQIVQGSFSRTLRWTSVSMPPLSHYVGESIFPCTNLTALLSALGIGTAGSLAYDTDGTLAANSDQRIPTQKAVKTYAQPLDADLTALAALSGTHTIYYRSGVGAWTAVAIGSGLDFTLGTLSATGGSAASTSSAGIVELLTQAEYDAGTDTTRVPTANLNRIAQPAATASTSGTSIDFTGIPTGVNRVTAILAGVSTSGTALPLIQIGTGSSPTTSGYVGTSDGQVSGGGTTQSNTAGLVVGRSGLGGATQIYSGRAVFDRVTGNNWVGTFVGCSTTGSTSVCYGATQVSLAGELNMIRFTTTNGTDTFDAGNVKISYER